MAYDRHRSKVLSLVHFDGPPGSTTIVDQTGRPWSAAGGAQIVTDSSAMGGTQLDLNGSSGYVHTPNDPGWRFLLTENYTFEMWFTSLRTPAAADGETLVSTRNQNATGWDFRVDSGNTLYLFAFGGATFTSPAALFPLPSGRMHVAVVLAEENYMIWVNGALYKLGVRSTPTVADSGVLQIGRSGYSSLRRWTRCRVDEFRFTQYARYRTPFTPPSEPFSLAGLTVAGSVNFGTPPSPASRKIILINTSLNPPEVVGVAESDPETGLYSIETDADDGDAIMGLAQIDYGSGWQPGAAYALESTCLSKSNNQHWYECEAEGISGTVEPTWPTDGGTVVDGTVTWRDRGVMERPWAEGPYVPPVT